MWVSFSRNPTTLRIGCQPVRCSPFEICGKSTVRFQLLLSIPTVLLDSDICSKSPHIYVASPLQCCRNSATLYGQQIYSHICSKSTTLQESDCIEDWMGAVRALCTPFDICRKSTVRFLLLQYPYSTRVSYCRNPTTLRIGWQRVRSALLHFHLHSKL